MKLSVVIPVYNRRYTIREIMRRVFNAPVEPYEVIVVDDGSNDGTPEILKSIERSALNNSRRFTTRFIYKDKNEGKGPVLSLALKQVSGDIVIIQEPDLDYCPKDYARLIQPLLDGKSDAVYGSRFISQERNVPLFWRIVVNKFLTLLCNCFTNLYLTDPWSGLKAFKAKMIRHIPLHSTGLGFEAEITIKIARLGFRIYEIAIQPNTAYPYTEAKTVGFKDVLTGLFTMLRTSFFGDLGELAIEHGQRILSNASRYNRMIYEEYCAHLGNRVIEVGSASGNNAKFLLDRELLVLTDVNQSYAELLEHTYKDWDNVRVARLDITNLESFTESKSLIGTFDTVICLNVIEHIQNDSMALKNLHALLRPDGKGIFIIPAHQSLYGAVDSTAGHFKRYSATEFSRQLQTAEFEILECRYFNPVAVLGWWLNGKVLGRKMMPSFQVLLFDKIAFLIRWLKPLRLPFGISLLAIVRR